MQDRGIDKHCNVRVPFLSLILILNSGQAFITMTYSSFSLCCDASALTHSSCQVLRALAEFHMVVVIVYIQQSFIYQALSYNQNFEELKFTQVKKSFFYFLLCVLMKIFLKFIIFILFLKQCIMSITFSYCSFSL